MKLIQVKTIGTHELNVDTVCDVGQLAVLMANYERIFSLGSIKAQKRDDGTFDVTMTLKPDNGTAAVFEYPRDSDKSPRLFIDQHGNAVEIEILKPLDSIATP